MPSVHSKLSCSDIQQHINLQNEVLEFWMSKVKPLVNILKMGPRRLRNLSYEAQKVQLEFYTAVSTICPQAKAKALADHLFKGAMPRDQELNYFVQFYAAMFKRL